MALRLSAALRNFMMEGGSMKHAMSNCVLKVYTGAQPATAETAPSGTLLCTYSDASGALTREVASQGKVVISGSSGSLDTLTVNSIEIMGSATSYLTSLTITTAAIVTKINDNPKNQLFVASQSGTDTIIITAKAGMGTLPDGWVVASTATTLGRTDTNMGTLTAGVAAANGLKWGDSAAGVLSKLSTQTWSGVAAATGTAGWFRIEASATDAGGADSTESIMRIDGSIATSGAELNMTPTSITSAATQTISSFSLTLPTA